MSYSASPNYLIGIFKNAKEYGSIIEVDARDYDGLISYLYELRNRGSEDLFTASWLNEVLDLMLKLIKQAKILSQKYHIVATNPPYLNKMDFYLKEFVNKNYKDYSADLFSVFMYRNFGLCLPKGYLAFMTPFVWMFIKTYEKLRKFIIKNKSISSLVQMEYSAFEEATVPICSFILKNSNSTQPGYYFKLSEFKGGMEVQKKKVLDSISNRDCKYIYRTKIENFARIPGNPIAYWVSESVIRAFQRSDIRKISEGRMGLTTGNNDYYLRLWYEVIHKNIGFNLTRYQAKVSGLKWFPYNKGGEFRKWYGNREYIVNWLNDGQELQTKKHPDGNRIWAHNFNLDYIFKRHISWSDITSGMISFRAYDDGFLFDSTGAAVFVEESHYFQLLGYLNSCFVNYLVEILNPTMHFKLGDYCNLPYLITQNSKIDDFVKECLMISKMDWDSFETSWDFKRHPLIQNSNKIEVCFANWQCITDKAFTKLKSNEEELNRIFIEIYGLQDELTPEVEDKDVTIRKADLQRDIRSFISYAVGCMFGRYSLDVEGLVYAGGEWDGSKYTSFIPDKDNVLPITDEEYFDDDIVARFVNFVKVVYGEETLEENLDFISNALGNKGNTAREVIRNYFLKDFYKDHIKTYQKRPIYWLFDSGKENGFKALIYLHRYNEDTVGRVRVDYLHRTQAALENAIAHCDVVLESNASPSDKAKAVKRKEKLVKQLAETRLYDQAIAHVAHQRIPLDLDDGVKVNYAKFQGIEVSREGKKSVKVDLLAKI